MLTFDQTQVSFLPVPLSKQARESSDHDESLLVPVTVRFLSLCTVTPVAWEGWKMTHLKLAV